MLKIELNRKKRTRRDLDTISLHATLKQELEK